ACIKTVFRPVHPVLPRSRSGGSCRELPAAQRTHHRPAEHPVHTGPRQAAMHPPARTHTPDRLTSGNASCSIHAIVAVTHASRSSPRLFADAESAPPAEPGLRVKPDTH